jgi:hypothetical protein
MDETILQHAALKAVISKLSEMLGPGSMESAVYAAVKGRAGGLIGVSPSVIGFLEDILPGDGTERIWDIEVTENRKRRINDQIKQARIERESKEHAYRRALAELKK